VYEGRKLREWGGRKVEKWKRIKGLGTEEKEI
jgi:hypothetical protein